MSNSKLASFKKISPNRTSPRNHAIDTLTIHCYVGQVTIQDMAAWLCNPEAEASANYGIDKDGAIGLFVEEKDRSWCSSNRENDHRAITIECASNKTSPYKINQKVYASLIRLCADICQRNNIKKLVWSTDKNTRINHLNGCNMTVHRDYAAKACPGDYIYERLGQIAAEVNAVLGSGSAAETHMYRVRKTWKDAASQTGAYEILDNAKADADRHPGYSVYDETGKTIYTSASSEPYTPAEWIAMIAPIAQALAEKYQILPSVLIAQTALETGWGSTDLTRKYNIVGMKASLINESWKNYSTWDGTSYTKTTTEYYDGKKTSVKDSFRVYHSFREGLEDYCNFLLHVSNSKGLKYARIQGWTDPQKVISAIRIGTGTDAKPEGYFTDPNYVTKIMKLIQDYNLTQYDSVMAGTIDKYQVSHELKDTKHRLGLFHILQNAKIAADTNWGYKVYDIQQGKLVYEPKLSAAQKLCGECVYLDQLVQDDIKAKKIWTYKNVNTKKLSRTFDQAVAENNRKVNCSTGVYWALLRAGVVNANRDGIQWNGNNGFTWLNNHARQDALKYFHLISVRNKTVKECVKDGTLQPGDVVSYVGIAHTTIYIAHGLFFDTGHHNCSGTGEGAKFKCWVSAGGYQNYKVAEILRPR